MRIFFLLALSAFVVGCTGQTKIPGSVVYFLESEYLPLADGNSKYKYFVIANGIGGGYSSFYEHNKTHLFSSVRDALARCEKRKKEWINDTGTCRIAYLGNEKARYTSEEELQQQLQAYIDRMKTVKSKPANNLARWSDKKVLSYACDETIKDWNIDYPVAINEAKARQLDCGS